MNWNEQNSAENESESLSFYVHNFTTKRMYKWIEAGLKGNFVVVANKRIKDF